MVRVLIILLTIVGGYGEAVSTTASLPRRHVVEIHGFQFHPQRIQVSPGDTVIWKNRDIVPHTITADEGQWATSILEEGRDWEVVVEERGVYLYYCEFHPHMTGALTIR